MACSPDTVSSAAGQSGSGYSSCMLYRRKLCQIVRDDRLVCINEVSATFRRLGFEVRVYDLQDGFAANYLRDFLVQLAAGRSPGIADSAAAGEFGCLLLLFVGGFAVDGRLTVNGAPYDFLQMVAPFRFSSYWLSKPKLFFCHVAHNDRHPSSQQPVDAAPVWSARPPLPSTPDDDVSVAVGGPGLLGCLCRAVSASSSDAQTAARGEFKALMARLEQMMLVEAENGVSLDYWCDCRGIRFPLYLRAEV